MSPKTSTKSAFAEELRANNVGGSGKAASYLRALELLEETLNSVQTGFEDCRDIWAVSSPERLIQLRLRVLEEQKLGVESAWMIEGIPVSYLRDGYCSAALTQLIEFLVQRRFSEKVSRLVDANSADEPALFKALNIVPLVPDDFVFDAKSQDGKERLQTIKTRIGQRTFRDMVLRIYQNRCCLTGIDLPEVNRASHIIGWAERADTRMDPRNGLCLSATYDAAFDRKLITFDDDYRMVLCKTIRDRVPNETLKAHFLRREGQRIEMPERLFPLKEYLDHHRRGGIF
jgi:putative restriction endonuclease